MLLRTLASSLYRAGLSKRGAVAGFGCNGEHGARAYNRGLGAEPPAGSKGQSPGGGSGGKAR